jgi:hypothetical protein
MRPLPFIKDDEWKVIFEAGQHTVDVDFFLQNIVPASAVRTVHANEPIPRCATDFASYLNLKRTRSPVSGQAIAEPIDIPQFTCSLKALAGVFPGFPPRFPHPVSSH